MTGWSLQGAPTRKQRARGAHTQQLHPRFAVPGRLVLRALPAVPLHRYSRLYLHSAQPGTGPCHLSMHHSLPRCWAAVPAQLKGTSTLPVRGFGNLLQQLPCMLRHTLICPAARSKAAQQAGLPAGLAWGACAALSGPQTTSNLLLRCVCCLWLTRNVMQLQMRSRWLLHRRLCLFQLR